MTNQQVFDRVYDLFVRKGIPRSVIRDDEGVIKKCLYGTGVNGYGCAIGCQEGFQDILDLEWDENGHMISWLLLNREGVSSLFDEVDPDLLADLQTWHDNNRDEQSLKNIGVNYGLKSPEEKSNEDD